jgi:hypothetical protein
VATDGEGVIMMKKLWTWLHQSDLRMITFWMVLCGSTMTALLIAFGNSGTNVIGILVSDFIDFLRSLNSAHAS